MELFSIWSSYPTYLGQVTPHTLVKLPHGMFWSITWFWSIILIGINGSNWSWEMWHHARINFFEFWCMVCSPRTLFIQVRICMFFLLYIFIIFLITSEVTKTTDFFQKRFFCAHINRKRSLFQMIPLVFNLVLQIKCYAPICLFYFFTNWGWSSYPALPSYPVLR